MTRIAASVAILFVTASLARAQTPSPKEQADAAAKQAEARFQSADYGGAVESFKAAYALDPDPGYLFDIAQAYRLAGDCTNAADYYRRLLAVVPNPPNLDKVNTWLAEQRACAEQHARDEKTIGVVRPPAQPQPQPMPDQPMPTAVRNASSHLRRNVELGLAGVGAGALVVAGYFTWDSHALHGDMEALLASCTIAAPCSTHASSVLDDYDNRGRRANTIAVTSYVVSGAAIAATVAILVWPRSAAETPIAIATTPGGAMVLGAWRF
jgi:tetratricopeptide (TPR) repeat protein